MTHSAKKLTLTPQVKSKIRVYQPNKTTVTSAFPSESPIPVSLRPKLPKKAIQCNSKRFSPIYKGFVWGVVVGATALASAIFGATVASINPVVKQLPILGQNLATISHFSLLPRPLDRPVHVLVLGIDRVLDAPKGSPKALDGRSDTILLLRFDPADQSLKMLSIPRDSRVEIPGVGYKKINDANVVGGVSLATKVVSQTLGDVPIDRYIRVTTDVFVELVDLLGGVDIFVPQDMNYRDQTQNLEIDLKKGWQALNGQQAEQFARFRNSQQGDIGRVQRQQMLLKAIQRKAVSPLFLPKLPQAIEILQKSMDTNLSNEEIICLANFGREIPKENLKMVLLPGRFSQPHEYDGLSYWDISGEKNNIKQIMANYFDNEPQSATLSEKSPHNLRIALQNASDDPHLARQVKRRLIEQNFNHVFVIQDSLQVLAETEVVVQKGDLMGAQQLQSQLGIGKVEASSTGDLDSDITIRIGLDAKRLNGSEGFLKSAHR